MPDIFSVVCFSRGTLPKNEVKGPTQGPSHGRFRGKLGGSLVPRILSTSGTQTHCANIRLLDWLTHPMLPVTTAIGKPRATTFKRENVWPTAMVLGIPFG